MFRQAVWVYGAGVYGILCGKNVMCGPRCMEYLLDSSPSHLPPVV